MQKILAVDLTSTKYLRILITIIHLLTLIALVISGLHLLIMILLAGFVMLIWGGTHYKYIKQHHNYQLLAYFDDLPSALNSPASLARSGWRLRNSEDEWLNLALQNHSIFLNFFILLTFVVERENEVNGASGENNKNIIESAKGKKEYLQIPLINGDLSTESFRSLKVFLRLSS